MLRGATPRAEEMAGTAVLRIVVSSDSIKKATATSHGRSCLEASEGWDEDGGAINGRAWFTCAGFSTPNMLPSANAKIVNPFLESTCHSASAVGDPETGFEATTGLLANVVESLSGHNFR